MTLDRAAWAGTLDGVWTGPTDTVWLESILGAAPDGGSGAFMGLTSSGRFFVKPLNNAQSPRVTINEYVLGRMGKLIGAPVCDVAVVEIPPELAGEQFCPQAQLEA